MRLIDSQMTRSNDRGLFASLTRSCSPPARGILMDESAAALVLPRSS